MGKRKAEQPHSDPQGPTDNGPDKITSQPGPTEPLPAVAVRPVGAGGTVAEAAGITETSFESGDTPTLLLAAML